MTNFPNPKKIRLYGTNNVIKKYLTKFKVCDGKLPKPGDLNRICFTDEFYIENQTLHILTDELKPR